MTTYVAYSTSATGSEGHIAIRSTTLDVRIIGVEIVDGSQFASGAGGSFGIAPASTISGGVVRTPYPTHAGAPAATAQARSFATITPALATTIGWFDTGPVGGVTVWKPLGDLILNPGAVFNVTWGYGASAVWFEEMRLSWSY